MNKTAVLITFLIIATAVGVFWGYEKYYKQGELTRWDLIPKKAGIVYEPQNGRESINSFYEGELGEVFGNSPAGEKLKNNLTFLDSLFGEESFNKILKQTEPLIIAEPVSSTDAGFLILANISALSSPNQFTRAMFKLSSEYSTSKRNYNNSIINEIKVNGKIFSYAVEQGFWFGSFQPVMVEDIIRRISELVSPGFKNKNIELFGTATLKGDEGNIYINNKELTRLVNIFFEPLKRIDGLKDVAESSFYDLNVRDKTILLNGFSFDKGNDGKYSSLKGVKPYPSNIRLYIPSSTAFFQHYLVPEFKSDSDLAELIKVMRTEIGFAYLEAPSIDESEHLTFVRVNDSQEARLALLKFAETSRTDNDTVFYEDFSEYRIFEVEAENLFQRLTDFAPYQDSTHYITVINDLMIFGNSLNAVKTLILDVETENTWGKSLLKTELLSNALDQSAYSLYFDVPKVLFMFRDYFHEDWKAILNENDETLRKFRMGSVQYSYTDDKIYTNISIAVDTKNSFNITDRRKLDPDVSAELTGLVAVKPTIVRNHVDGSWEMITGTENGLLTLVSSDGIIQWEDSLKNKIVGEIKQIDYYKNGKLQYFFTTDSSLNVVDRNGNALEGFPVSLDYKVDQMNILDYSNSRDYRFIISDIRGNVYMYDKQGNNLEGWKPNTLNGRLSVPPEHIRIRGRDCILMFQEKGNMIVTNRRGELLPGFPVKVGVNLASEYAVVYGKDFASSKVVTISREGVLKKISLTGKIVETQQVLRLKRDSRFSIVPDVLGRDYVIARKEIGSFVIIDSQGKDIFMESLISSNDFIWQYYNFGSNRKLFAITDPEQEFTYLYNEKGSLINKSPINSKFKIGVIFSETRNEFKIYSAYDQFLNIYSF